MAAAALDARTMGGKGSGAGGGMWGAYAGGRDNRTRVGFEGVGRPNGGCPERSPNGWERLSQRLREIKEDDSVVPPERLSRVLRVVSQEGRVGGFVH